MLGVDDNRPERLRLVPRYPVSFSLVELRDYPVTLGAERASLSYRIDRSEDSYSASVELSRKALFDARLGPFASFPEGTVTVNGRAHPSAALRSGDAFWLWVRDLAGDAFRIEYIGHTQPERTRALSV